MHTPSQPRTILTLPKDDDPEDYAHSQLANPVGSGDGNLHEAAAIVNLHT
jgi:hypothetical protein